MNAIAQVWTGPITPLVEASCLSIRNYAHQIGAEYCMTIGSPVFAAWHKDFSPQAQKLVVLDGSLDRYESVAMFDCDMFAVADLTESIFEQPGNGFHQQQAHKRVTTALPGLASSTAGFFGGSLYRFSRDERKALRAQINYDELKAFDNAQGGWDEGMMFLLCTKAGIPARYLSEQWAWSSHYPRVGGEKFIHIRSKPTGDKLANYRALRDAGVIQ